MCLEFGKGRLRDRNGKGDGGRSRKNFNFQAGEFPFNSMGDRELEEVRYQEGQSAKGVGMECVGERQKKARPLAGSDNNATE